MILKVRAHKRLMLGVPERLTLGRDAFELNERPGREIEPKFGGEVVINKCKAELNCRVELSCLGRSEGENISWPELTNGEVAVLQRNFSHHMIDQTRSGSDGTDLYLAKVSARISFKNS